MKEIKKIFSVILLIFCHSFIITNVCSIDIENYKKLVSEVAEILGEKGVHCPYKLLEDGETYALFTTNNKIFLTAVKKQIVDPRNNFSKEFVSDVLYLITAYKNTNENFERKSNDFLQSKEENCEKAVRFLEIIKEIKWD